jgi:hypothetical protein
VSGQLTPECAAIWLPLIDATSGPVPAVNGLVDERRPTQRRHDGIHDLGLRAGREGSADSGGIAAVLLLSMTAEQYTTRQGLAVTGHGDLIPVARVLAIAEEVQILSTLYDPHGAILDYGLSKRLVPPPMRLALIGRDKGCTFPNCDRPPAWTQAHHLLEYAKGGPTSLANTYLVCGFHHREFERRGWSSVMINNIPHWRPPDWIDKHQTPLRNTYFDPAQTTIPPRAPDPDE